MKLILATALFLALTSHTTVAQTGPALEEYPGGRLLVLPFEQLDTDPQHVWIAQAIHQTLMVDLAQQTSFLPVTLSSQHANALDRQDRSALIAAADDTGARLILTGTYQVVAGQIRMTAALLDVAHEDPLAVMRTTAEIADLFDLQDSLAEQVVLLLQQLDPQHLPREQPPVLQPPPAAVERYRPIYDTGLPYDSPPPPAYVYSPTYYHYYPTYLYPSPVYCPIWYTAPIRTTSFFFIVKSGKERSKPHNRLVPPRAVVADAPRTPDEMRRRLLDRPEHTRAPAAGPEPVRPRLRAQPFEPVADAPHPPTNTLRTPPQWSSDRPAPAPEVVRETTRAPRRPDAAPRRLRNDPPAVIYDSPRPPAPARPQDRGQTLTQPRLTPQPQPAPAATPTPPRLRSEPPSVIYDSPRPPANVRGAEERRPSSPARTLNPQPQAAPRPASPPPTRTTMPNPPRLGTQSSAPVADSPQPPARSSR